MVIELSDAMYARLVKLANRHTSDEGNEFSPDYDDGYGDGQIILAREFLDEAVITHDA